MAFESVSEINTFGPNEFQMLCNHKLLFAYHTRSRAECKCEKFCDLNVSVLLLVVNFGSLPTNFSI